MTKVSPAYSRRAFAAMMLASAAACTRRPPASNVVEIIDITNRGDKPRSVLPDEVVGYGPLQDAGYNLPGIPSQYLQGANRRAYGLYAGEADWGSIDVDPYAKFLYHVRSDGSATRYPVGVGRQGRSISGGATIRLKKKWPGWTPTANMLRTEPEVYGDFRGGIPGGLRSPLGSRALYLYRGGRDTFYRIHGTNDLESIGNSGSAGCIRMFNQDIIHLYNEIEVPMKVHIRSEAESLRVDPENFNRGRELPPKIISAEELLGPEAVALDRPPLLDET